jgi:hypothetical protein
MDFEEFEEGYSAAYDNTFYGYDDGYTDESSNDDGVIDLTSSNDVIDLTSSDTPSVLNRDVLAKILAYSGEPAAMIAFCNQICRTVRESFYKCSKKLIYGEIQSGKTAKIIDEVRRAKLPVLLIIQNSRLVQKQYEQRFREAGIPIQVIRPYTTALTGATVILMNNKNQMAKYTALNTPKTYAILLDESDLTQFHPLRANASVEIHVTATPFRYRASTFDEIEFVEKHPNYYGLDKIHLKPIGKEIDYFAIANEFRASQGILLINTFTRIDQMRTMAMNLSNAHPTVPVILLTTYKGVYTNGVFNRLRGQSLNRLLDQYAEESHVIIVANRMATRGISFSNSAHTTHITHQVSNPNTITGFLQKCRILGIYPNLPQLTLYIDEGFVSKIEKYKKAIVDRAALSEYHQNKERKMGYKSCMDL